MDTELSTNNNVLISGKPPSIVVFLKKTIEYRHLIWLFAKRELKIKYTQTFLKNALLLFQPLIMMTVFSVFFGYILGWKSQDLPFPIYVFSGLIIWNLVQTGIYSSLHTLSENANLIKNNPLPKSIFTLYKLVISTIDTFINIGILLIMMLFFGVTPSIRIVFLVIPVCLTLLLNISLVWMLQLISLRNKDILHLVPTILNAVIWITPVFFTPDILPDSLHFILYINPVTALIELWRYILIPNYQLEYSYLWSLCFLIPASIFSVYFYSKADKKINDSI